VTLGKKEGKMGIKWWYWVLLGLGSVLFFGGIVYAILSRQIVG